jgi:hypothetical protein
MCIFIGRRLIITSCPTTHHVTYIPTVFCEVTVDILVCVALRPHGLGAVLRGLRHERGGCLVFLRGLDHECGRCLFFLRGLEHECGGCLRGLDHECGGCLFFLHGLRHECGGCLIFPPGLLHECGGCLKIRTCSTGYILGFTFLPLR